MRTTVNIPDDLYARFKAYARGQRKPMSKLVCKLIITQLGKEDFESDPFFSEAHKVRRSAPGPRDVAAHHSRYVAEAIDQADKEGRKKGHR